MKIVIQQFSYVAHLPNGQQLNLQFGLAKDGNYLAAVREYRGLVNQALADLDAELAAANTN